MRLLTAWWDESSQRRDALLAAAQGPALHAFAALREGWAELDRIWRISLVAALVCAGGLCFWALSLDRSQPLNSGAVAELRAWAVGTQSVAVRDAMAVAERDGEVTRNEAGEVIEQAKLAPVPAGLLSPVDEERY